MNSFARFQFISMRRIVDYLFPTKEHDQSLLQVLSSCPVLSRLPTSLLQMAVNCAYDPDKDLIIWPLKTGYSARNVILERAQKNEIRALWFVMCNDLSAILRESLPLCPRLRVISIEGTEIEDSTVTLIADLCPAVRSLKLNYSRITDKGLCEIADRLPHLKSLSLASAKITDRFVIRLAQRCSMLEHIDLCHTGVGDESVAVIALTCFALRNLLLKNTKVTDASITAVAEFSTNLQSLNLTNTVVTDESISKIAKQCKNIACLYLVNTKITVNTIDLLRQHAHCLRVIHADSPVFTGASVSTQGLESRQCTLVPWKRGDAI